MRKVHVGSGAARVRPSGIDVAVRRINCHRRKYIRRQALDTCSSLSRGPAKTRTGVQCLPASVLRDTNMLLKSVVLALRMPTSPEAKIEYTLWLTGSATTGPAVLLNVALPVVGPASVIA